MTRLSTLSNVSHPSPHEILLWTLPHLLDISYGGGLHPATSVCSTVPPLHRYLVHMDGLQDHFLSRSESFPVRRLPDMYSTDRRSSLLAQRHPCSRSLAFSNAACGCGFTCSCATSPTKHAAVTKTNSTTRGVLFRLEGFLNPGPSLCAGLPSYSAYFCRRSTTRISFSQPSASWPSHSHTMSWAHLALSLEKLSVLPEDIPLSKLVPQQSLVCHVIFGREGLLFGSRVAHHRQALTMRWTSYPSPPSSSAESSFSLQSKRKTLLMSKETKQWVA